MIPSHTKKGASQHPKKQQMMLHKGWYFKWCYIVLGISIYALPTFKCKKKQQVPKQKWDNLQKLPDHSGPKPVKLREPSWAASGLLVEIRAKTLRISVFCGGENRFRSIKNLPKQCRVPITDHLTKTAWGFLFWNFGKSCIIFPSENSENFETKEPSCSWIYIYIWFHQWIITNLLPWAIKYLHVTTHFMIPNNLNAEMPWDKRPIFEAFASMNVPPYKSFQAHNSFNNRKKKKRKEKKDSAFGQWRFISFEISKSFFPIPLFSTQILTTFPTSPTHNPTCVGHFVSLHIIQSWPEHPPGRVPGDVVELHHPTVHCVVATTWGGVLFLVFAV